MSDVIVTSTDLCFRCANFNALRADLKNKSRKIKSAKKTFDTGGDVVMRSDRHDSKHEEIDADDKESML